MYLIYQILHWYKLTAACIQIYMFVKAANRLHTFTRKYVPGITRTRVISVGGRVSLRLIRLAKTLSNWLIW